MRDTIYSNVETLLINNPDVRNNVNDLLYAYRYHFGDVNPATLTEYRRVIQREIPATRSGRHSKDQQLFDRAYTFQNETTMQYLFRKFKNVFYS